MGLFRRRGEDALAEARRRAGVEEPAVGSVSPAPAPEAIRPPPEPAAAPDEAPRPSPPSESGSQPRTIAEEFERASRDLETPDRPGRVGPPGPARLPRR